MTVTRQDIDFLVATAKAAAETEIMPHFSNLTAADIKTKAHASDFVTIADVAAEELIEKRIRSAWGNEFLFVGEEVMEREPTLIDKLMAAPRAVVVDRSMGRSITPTAFPLSPSSSPSSSMAKSKAASSTIRFVATRPVPLQAEELPRR